MNIEFEQQSGQSKTPRLIAAAALLLLAVLAFYRAWLDIATIAIQDPEQSQVLLALPAIAILLFFRRTQLANAALESSLLGVATALIGWGMSWYGYMHAVQSLWHAGAVLMLIGAMWSVFGSRALLIALPAVIAMIALVPVPNLLRQDIALPLQRITAIGAEFVLIALGFSVKRLGQTLLYQDKPVTIEEACNGMRMVFALVLVCYTFVMAYRLSTFARILLLAFSPVLAVACNIIRVVPTVTIYGEYGDQAGDIFHDLSGWAMIALAAGMLLGLIRVLTWAQVPIYSSAELPTRKRSLPAYKQRLPWLTAPLACVLLMSAAAAYNLTLPSAVDAQPYHQAVASAADATPIQIDGIDARPMEIPEGSLKLLRPNTARAVKYIDPETGVTGQFLLIQSKDARDLSGHYPPRCYPNVYGYVEVDRIARQWQVNGNTFNGIEYTFAETQQAGAPRWVVMHYFALPGGGTTGKLSEMRAAAADYQRRHQGAAQVQLLFSETGASQQERDTMFKQIMGAHSELLRIILDGTDKIADKP